MGGLEETDDAIAAAGGSATLVAIDLTGHDEIDRLGAAIYQRFGRLDILVGAAARIGMLTPVGHMDPVLWQQVIDLNLTANYRLIRVLDPLLRQSAAGHALFATCAQGQVPAAYWGAYAASKAGLAMLVESWARELAETRVRVTLVDPGPTATRLRAQAFPGEDARRLPSPAEAAKAFLDPILSYDPSARPIGP
jgi:NAD(P)-dependent dehydrogenase (short-subunit alcohol dehydrogenase family)